LRSDAPDAGNELAVWVVAHGVGCGPVGVAVGLVELGPGEFVATGLGWLMATGVAVDFTAVAGLTEPHAVATKAVAAIRPNNFEGLIPIRPGAARRRRHL